MSNEHMPVPAHKHCLVCGKPISPDEQVCSSRCEQVFLRQLRSQRRTSWILMGIVVVVLLVWLFLSGKTGG